MTDGLLDPPGELVETGLDHRPFGLGVGGETIEPAAQICLGLADPHFQRGDELVALPVEARGRLREPPLEPLDALVADMGQALREYTLGLARERLHGAIELTRESPGCVLPRTLDRLGELLCRRFGVAGSLAFDNALEPFDVALL